MADDQGKKLIIDDDWKEEAKREKDILAAKEKEAQEQEEEAQTHGRTGPLPPAELSGLVSMLATQAFFALGLVHAQGEPEEEKEPDLEMAKFNIDLLGMLEEKTKGNLTDQEDKLLQDTVNQLRMAFVQMSKGK
jgi:hypothetical protein